MANDALTCLSFKDLDRYIHNDGSINTFGADTKEIGSLSLSDVRKRLEEDKAEMEELRDAVSRNRAENLAAEVRVRMNQAQNARMKKIQEQAEAANLREAERQHRERELKLTIERERLKRQLKSMDGERLDALQDEQRRAITLLEKEREAIAAQEMETALQIEKAESQLREEEQRRADLRERVLGNPHQSDDTSRQVEVARGHGERKLKLQLEQDQLERKLKESRQQLADLKATKTVQGLANNPEALDGLVQQLSSKSGISSARQHLDNLRTKAEEEMRSLSATESDIRSLGPDSEGTRIGKVDDNPELQLQQWLENDRSALLSGSVSRRLLSTDVSTPSRAQELSEEKAIPTEQPRSGQRPSRIRQRTDDANSPREFPLDGQDSRHSHEILEDNPISTPPQPHQQQPGQRTSAAISHPTPRASFNINRGTEPTADSNRGDAPARDLLARLDRMESLLAASQRPSVFSGSNNATAVPYGDVPPMYPPAPMAPPVGHHMPPQMLGMYPQSGYPMYSGNPYLQPPGMGMDFQQQAFLREVEQQAAAVEAENARMQYELEHIQGRAPLAGGHQNISASGLDTSSLSGDDPAAQELRRMQATHALEMARNKYEREKLESEAELESLREKLRTERAARQKELEHASWMEEQKRRIQSMRAMKAYAKETPMPGEQNGQDAGSKDPVIYDPEVGLHVYFDFAAGVPMKLRSARYGFSDMRLVYGLYPGLPTKNMRPVGKVGATEWSELEATQTDALGATVVFARSHIFGTAPQERACLASTRDMPDPRMMFEIQGRPANSRDQLPGEDPSKSRDSKPISLGWAIFDLRAGHEEDSPTPWFLNVGNHKLSLIPGAYPRGMDYATAFQKLGPGAPSGHQFSLYVRVSSVAQEPAPIPVDPFLAHHLYTAFLVDKGMVDETASGGDETRLNSLPESGSPEPAMKDLAVGPQNSRTDASRSSLLPSPTRSEILLLHFVALELTNQFLGKATGMNHVVGVRFRITENPRKDQPDEVDDWKSHEAAAVQSGRWEWAVGEQVELPPATSAVLFRLYEAPKAPASRASTRSSRSRGNAGIILATAEMSMTDYSAPGSRSLSFLNDKDAREEVGKLEVELKPSSLENSLPEEGQSLGETEHGDDDGDLWNLIGNSDAQASEDLWLDVDNSAAIKNAGLPRTLFQKGDGFDIYIDGARQLPASVSITKIEASLVKTGDKGQAQSCPASIENASTLMNPSYNLRMEFREDSFDPRSLLMIRIDTLEREQGASYKTDGAAEEPEMRLVTVGYAVLNVFVEPDDESGQGSRQPPTPNVTEFSLNAGSHQIPLRVRPPKRTLKSCDVSQADDIPVVPCATVLLRILPAPRSKDGLTVLSREDEPQSIWAALGLDVPPPENGYQSRTYDSTRTRPSATEKKMYTDRLNNPDLDKKVQDEVYAAIRASPLSPPDLTDEYLGKWILAHTIDETTAPKRSKSLLDYRTVHPYRPDLGFLVSVDSILNIEPPRKKGFLGGKAAYPFHKVVYFLNPPAGYLQVPKVLGETQFTRELDLDSPQPHPRFKDGLQPFRNELLSDGTVLCMEIRSLSVDGIVDPPGDGYWAALPICRRYSNSRIPWTTVDSGVFGIPMFKGAIPPEFVELLRADPNADAYQWIESNLSSGRKNDKGGNKIEFAGVNGFGAVVVRVVDDQLDPAILRLAKPLVEEQLEEEHEDSVHAPDLELGWFNRLHANSSGNKKTDPAAVVEEAHKATSDGKKLKALRELVENENELMKTLNVEFAKATEISHYRF